jgi:hypothetical protein
MGLPFVMGHSLCLLYMFTLLQTLCVYNCTIIFLKQYTIQTRMPSVQALCSGLCLNMLSLGLWRHLVTWTVIHSSAVMLKTPTFPVSRYILLRVNAITDIKAVTIAGPATVITPVGRPWKYVQGTNSINDSLHSLAGRFMVISSQGK